MVHSQLAYVILRQTNKPVWVATTSNESTAQLLTRVKAKRLIKRVNTNPQRKRKLFNPTISGLQSELAQADQDIAELETDPFYRETPGRRAFARKWLAYHRRQRREIERLIRGLERAAQRRANGIVEAAAGLQALEYIGGKAKRAGLGKKPKFNPRITKIKSAESKTGGISLRQLKEAADAGEQWAQRQYKSALASVRRLRKLEHKNPQGFRQKDYEQLVKEYGAKKARRAFHYWIAQPFNFRGSVKALPFLRSNEFLWNDPKYDQRVDNPRAKGSRDALGVFHAENPKGTPADYAATMLELETIHYRQSGKGRQFLEDRVKKASAEYQTAYVDDRKRLRKALAKARALLQKKNPSVTDLSRTFQGEADGSIDRLYAADGAPANIARAGKLVFIKVNGKTFRLPGAMVGIAPTGKLWITGPGALFETKARKGEGLDVGEVTHICYETAKAHIGNGKTFEYVHEFGEDGGRRPHLIIDSEGMPILRGGDYKIRAEGIVN